MNAVFACGSGTWWASGALGLLYGTYPLLLLIYFCRASAAQIMDR